MMKHLTRNASLWLKGMIAAVIGSAANAVSMVVVDPSHFNFTRPGLIAVAKLAGSGALVALVMYLKQSPIPTEEPTQDK